MPPSAGPAMVAVCQPEEFQATALRKSVGRHERGQQRLTGRIGEGAGGAVDQRQSVDRPDRGAAEQLVEEKAEASQRRHRVAHHQHGAPVEPVRHVPGHEGEADRRHEPREPDQAQRQGIAGQVVDQPADRHVLHLDRQARGEARDEVELEIAVAERRPAVAARLGRSHPAKAGRGLPSRAIVRITPLSSARPFSRPMSE